MRPKYIRSSTNSPLILFLVHDVHESIQGSIVNVLRELNFNVLIVEMHSDDKDLANAIFCWGRMRSLNPDGPKCWVIGINDGAWIGMQLLMRRPEFERFIAINPPVATHDFSFLAPCPCSGMILDVALNNGSYSSFAQDVPKLIQKTGAGSSVRLDYRHLSGTFDDETHILVANAIKDYIIHAEKV